MIDHAGVEIQRDVLTKGDAFDAVQLQLDDIADLVLRQAVEDDTEGTLYAVVVGDYVYKYTHRQNSAYEGNVDAEKQADKTLEMIAVETVPAMLKTLRAIE